METEEKDAKDAEKSKKFGKVVRRAAPFAGAVAAAAIYAHTLGDVLYDTGKLVGESYHGYKTANTILALGAEKGVPAKQLGILPPDVRVDYEKFKDISGFERLTKSSAEVIEGMQRGAEHFPSVTSGPVRDLRSLKGKIIETTKGWLTGKDKNEVAQTNTKQYQENWNRISSLRVQALLKRTELDAKIHDYCEKLAVNEMNGIDVSGRKGLVELVKGFNNTSRLVEQISNLRNSNVNAIYLGADDQEYASAIKTAETYKIRPYEGKGFGNFFLLSGGLLAGILGYRGTKKVASLIEAGARTGYDLAKDARDAYTEIAPHGKNCARKIYSGAKIAGNYLGKTAKTMRDNWRNRGNRKT